MCLDRGQSRKCQFLPTWDPCIHSTAVQSDTGLLVERYAAVVLDTDELRVGNTYLLSA